MGRPNKHLDDRDPAQRFSAALKRLRFEAGLSQQRLAELITYDESSVKRAETGRLPGPGFVDRLQAVPEHYREAQNYRNLLQCLDDVRSTYAAARSGRKRPINARNEAHSTIVDASGDQYPAEKSDLANSAARITNLPPRNMAFFGRRNQLELLRRHFLDAKSTRAPRYAVVYGLGGVGKTQLVVQYAYQHSDEYDIIWWIAAEQVLAVDEQLTLLAQRLGVVDLADRSVAMHELWERLRARDRWLLIYDNADSLRTLSDFMPSEGGGHILVTSRTTQWGVSLPIRLDVLDRSESIRFLSRRLHMSTDHGLDDIAEALGDLPLALEQAAAYMTVTSTSPTEYVALLREHEPELLALGDPLTTAQTVATVWQVSLSRLREEDPIAEDLLALCAFMAPDSITPALLVENSAVLPRSLERAVADRIRFNALIGGICRYSLASMTPGGLAFHRLVQAVARAKLRRAAQIRWATIAVKLVLAAYPSTPSDPSVWPLCTDLMQHAVVCVRHAEKLGIKTQEMALLLSRMGVYLWSRFDLVEAREVQGRALAIWEDQPDADELDVADGLNNLGLVLWDMVDLENSTKAHTAALETRRQRLGADHPAVAVSLNNLGAVLWDSADLVAARDALEEGLNVLRACDGEAGPIAAAVLTNLGSVLVDQGRRLDALRLYLDALRILGERSSGTAESGGLPSASHRHSFSDVAVGRAVLDPSFEDLLRGTLSDGGRGSENELEQLERSIDIGQLKHWAEVGHATAAKTLDNLGVLVARSGAFQLAKALFEAVLTLRKGKLGEAHPDLGWSLTNLGVVEAFLGDLTMSLAHLKEGVEVRVGRLGAEHPDVATNLSSLGAVLILAGQVDEAYAPTQSALKIREAKIGSGHPATRKTRSNMQVIVARRE